MIVAGEAERDRILAQRRPKAVHCEKARIYECETCRCRGPWGEKWCWFGTRDDMKDGRPIRIFCGGACRQFARVESEPRDDRDYDAWPMVSQFEPDPDGAISERWSIVTEAARPDVHRKVPMPEWAGPGVCRWCLEPTVYESGKKKGQPAKRNWHNACYYEYRLHTEIAAQFDFLFDRDGPRCQICRAGGYASAGEGRIKPEGMSIATYLRTPRDQLAVYTDLKPLIVLEVDHVVPLWRAVLFRGDLAARRSWYGPTNLWLLCVECHKAKTAIEAAERAAVRRSA